MWPIQWNLIRRILSCALFLILAVVLLPAKGTAELPVPASWEPDAGKTFAIELEKSEDRIIYDAHLATDANSLLVLGGLYEGLYSYDPQTGFPRLALAEQASVSSDGLVWTFRLRPSLHFSNGDPITAQTFADSWLSLLEQSEPGESSSMASLLDVIQGAKEYRQGKIAASQVAIHSTDAWTLEITLLSPAPYLPSLLCHTAFSAIHPDNRANPLAQDPTQTIASGPFTLSEVDGQTILLRKNPWYWDFDGVESDYIHIGWGRAEAEIALAYLEGRVDWSQVFIPAQILADRNDLHLYPEYSTGFYYFSAATGPYADPRVRKALKLLVPWDKVRDLSGQIYPTDRLIPSSKPAAPVGMQGPSTDPVLAQTYLEQAGYPGGAGLPNLNMTIHRGSQLLQTAHFIADTWSDALGMTVVLDVVPLNIYSERPSQSPYDFAFITWIGDFHDAFSFLHMWTADSSYNLGNYSDPRFDSLMAQAMSSTQQNERAQALSMAEDLLLDEAAVIPIAHGFSSNIVNTARVRGWFDNPLNIHPLKYLSNRHINPGQ